ncbi:uncharacterized protein LOC134714418 [Mytilus trossulus]|uniref:uncharacterized protein LOC134714418 n=1 Tax=Mytilus trossulus TaxID=6551 RepID=UPI00300408B3
MAFGQRVFLLSIVALKTLGLVIENAFTTPIIEHKNFFTLPDIWQYAVDVNKYGLDLTGITTMTIEVKACQDASIIMSNSDDGDPKKPMYHFVIGGWNNNQSGIQRREDDTLLPVDSRQNHQFLTPEVCNCSEYRPFWISAIKGDLRIGIGLIVGINDIAEWTDPHPFTIRGIGIYTNIKHIGDWKF